MNCAAVLRPTVKPSYGSLAKSIGRIEQANIKIVNNVLEEIKHLLNETENVVIDLAEFGKLHANKKQVVHIPRNKHEARGFQDM